MNLEEAIAALLAEISTSHRGNTAQPGHKYYEAGRGKQYRRCECSYRDAGHGWHEYIAECTNGRQVVAINLNNGIHYGIVTCGPKGYHSSH